MKKIIIVIVLAMFLTSCEEEIIPDCNAASNELNEMCTDFKTVNLLGDNVVYDFAFHDTLSNTEWMNVIYQKEDYYDQLMEYSTNELISFEYDDDEFVPGNTASVTVNYNDGFNQKISKILFVEVRNSSTKLKDNGEPVQVKIGGFTHTVGDVTFMIDTHPNNTFVFKREQTNMYKEWYSEYLLLPYPEGFNITNDIRIYIEPMDIGMKVYVKKTVGDYFLELEVFYVLHNDNMIKPSYLMEPSNTQLYDLYSTNDKSYQLEHIVKNDKGGFDFTFTVSSDTETLFQQEISLTKDENSLLIPITGIEYEVTFNFQSEDVLRVKMVNDDSFVFYMIPVE